MLRIFCSIALTFVIIVNALFSTTYFVNGVKGNDTLKDYNGKSEKTAFKTIQRAVNQAEPDDIIVIEGLNGKEKIIYRESVEIPSGKNGIKLQGRNMPVISQSEKETKNNVGIMINSDLVRIQGIAFKGILGGEISNINLKGGAGIVVGSGVTDVFISEVEIENCNFGIVIYEAEVCRVYNNKIHHIKTVEGDKNSGGIGIYIYSIAKFLQGNQIGKDGTNVISNCERYGVYLGNEENLIVADMSAIDNNQFMGNGVGLGLFNIDGIVSVRENLFEGNNISVYIEGANLDVAIEQNVFKGSKSNYEVQGKDYDGSLLYDIWKHNGNVFNPNTCAIVQQDFKSIMQVEGYRFIFNDQNLLRQFLIENSKIELYEYSR